MVPFEQQQLHRISRVVEAVKTAARSLKSLHEMDARHLSTPTLGYEPTGRGCTPCAGGKLVEGRSQSMAILGVRSMDPQDPNEPIQRYFWSVQMGSNIASGATSSLMEPQQAAEKEAAVLNHKEQMK